MNRALNIAVVHPDLGIGGAERLVVDAALHLQSAGHRVTIFTAHHDRERCFDETRDGTLAVRVRGDFLPMQVAQRLRAPCAIARMAYLGAATARAGGPFDVIFCDLVSHAIPVLRLFSRARILFYCHFPDRLLAPRGNGWYRLYRAPIDRLEQWTTGQADRVLVNSRFTAAAFRRAFPRLGRLPPEVVYPGVDVARYGRVPALGPEAAAGHPTVLSIGRYDPSKNLPLALRAFALLGERLTAEAFARVRLVIAGAYDDRLQEQRATLRGLEALARQLRLEQQIVFLRSPGEAERLLLLARCRCVVYTPDHEHFGFVPLEAMAAGRPVVAVNRGGPRETIRDGETGVLCPPTPEAFAPALAALIADPPLAERMGRAARAHVAKHFSRAAFGERLDAVVQAVAEGWTGPASPRHHRGA